MLKLLINVNAEMLYTVAHHIEVSVSASDVKRRATVVARLGHVCAEFIRQKPDYGEMAFATS